MTIPVINESEIHTKGMFEIVQQKGWLVA